MIVGASFIFSAIKARQVAMLVSGAQGINISFQRNPSFVQTKDQCCKRSSSGENSAALIEEEPPFNARIVTPIYSGILARGLRCMATRMATAADTTLEATPSARLVKATGVRTPITTPAEEA